ncbi:uncharacterized protein HKW66_Vig0034480 [Vigna angularis]|uniref:Uncharacterized protein n=1 Tax=Phaseolus angularis TaxID=3914 RepID=A0A8T0L9F1_PHAAN|nr:uncharacterized protein HKW66_Vig0034480 [Vigna angularis]
MLLDSWWVLGVVEFGASFVVVSDPEGFLEKEDIVEFGKIILKAFFPFYTETLILSPSTLSSLPSILSSPNPISTTINLVVSRKPPWPPPLEPQITVIFNHHRESSIDTVKTLAIDEKKVGVGTLFSPLSSVSDVGKSPKLRGSLEKEERPWLSEVSADCYKVPDEAETGKVALRLVKGTLMLVAKDAYEADGGFHGWLKLVVFPRSS